MQICGFIKITGFLKMSVIKLYVSEINKIPCFRQNGNRAHNGGKIEYLRDNNRNERIIYSRIIDETYFEML